MDVNPSARDERRPSESEVVGEVTKHNDGIDAVALGEELRARGYGLYDVQETIRLALDRGAIQLGPRLRFYPKGWKP